MTQRLFNNNLTLLSAMISPSMRDIFESNISVLKEFLNGDSGLVDKFYDLEKSMPRGVTPEGLDEILVLKGWEDTDRQVVLSSYKLAYSESTRQIAYEQARETLLRAYINYLYKGDSITFIDKIRSSEIYFPKYGDLNDEFSEVVNFTNLPLVDTEDSLGRHFKSSIPFINVHTLQGNGYYQDQVICISSPPGSGKSLFCLNEALSALKQGFKVYYLALGDLVKFDMKYRTCTVLLNKSMNTILSNLNKYYLDAVNKYPELNNFSIDFRAPGFYTCQEWIDSIKHTGILDKYDVFIVDYDSNFRSISDNIYQKGDEIYTALVALAKNYHKIVIVVSQPKTNSWGKDMDLTSLAESSRKQQHVDLFIGLSPEFNVNNPMNSIGTLSIIKNRRGSLGKCFYLREPTGRFTVVNKDTYKAAQSSNYAIYMNDPDENIVEYSKLSVIDIANDIEELSENKSGGLESVQEKELSD